MFTFGIFTTHTPYIVMVVFYAYFLIFGVNKTGEGKIKVTEKSQTVQIHVDNSVHQAPANTYCFYSFLAESAEIENIEKCKVRQKWKHFGVDKTYSKDHYGNVFFGRPPPFLA